MHKGLVFGGLALAVFAAIAFSTGGGGAFAASAAFQTFLIGAAVVGLLALLVAGANHARHRHVYLGNSHPVGGAKVVVHPRSGVVHTHSHGHVPPKKVVVSGASVGHGHAPVVGVHHSFQPTHGNPRVPVRREPTEGVKVAIRRP